MVNFITVPILSFFTIKANWSTLIFEVNKTGVLFANRISNVFKFTKFLSFACTKMEGSMPSILSLDSAGSSVFGHNHIDQLFRYWYFR